MRPTEAEPFLKLINEVFGLAAFEHEIREVIGNTNWNILAERTRDARAAYPALTAALAVEAGTVGVKPLEWREAALCHGYGLIVRIAQTRFGAYQILKGSQGRFEVYFGSAPYSGAMDGIEAALAWAQADYEARILSALTTSPASSEETLEVLKALVETFGPRLYPADHAVSRARRLVDTFTSPASSGVEGEAVAKRWLVEEHFGGSIRWTSFEHELEARKFASSSVRNTVTVTPLYAHPAPTPAGEWHDQIEWLKSRLADLQLPSGKRDHDTREKWLMECGMPASPAPQTEGK